MAGPVPHHTTFLAEIQSPFVINILMLLAVSKRLALLITVAILFGIALSIYWFLRLNPAESAERLRHLNAGFILAVLGIGIFALCVRIVRWHFFLRNSGFMVRPADSARIFLAALMMVMTPGYVGEIIKAYWLRQRYGIAMRSSIPLIFFERFFDAFALVILFIVSTWFHSWWALAMPVLLVLFIGIFWRFFAPFCVRLASLLGRFRLFLFLSHSPQETPPDIRQLRRPYFFVVSVVLSLIAWAPVAFGLKFIAAGIGQHLAALDSIRIFCGGTLLGGVSLIPGGIAVTGSWFINALLNSGFPLSDAILAAALLRFSTLWFAFGIGCFTYFFFGRRREPLENLEKALHFDNVAASYDAQIPPHVRELLIQRKTGRMTRILDDTFGPESKPRGLDVGCGLGWYMERMTNLSYPTVGFDLSIEQARLAHSRAQGVAVADALALPFADQTFDFAYSINVLHHLPSREVQQKAFEEIARVLKPGGWFFLHEINVRNPLFRFYIGYIFPLIKNIDEGTEFWIRPRDLVNIDQWFMRGKTDYFTFLPDFVPQILMAPCHKIETLLEDTPLRVWSAHYMLALRKKD